MITPDEAKRELEKNCKGDCDKCKYHYYDSMLPYFYDEPKLRCRLNDVLWEDEQ